MTAYKSGYSVSIGVALNGITYIVGLVSFLSVVRYVGTGFSLAFACLFILAMFFDYYRRYAIPRGILNALLVAFIVINSLRITLDDFATPVVEAMLILIAVKFLEEKKTRDYWQIYAIATFLLTGSALMTLDLQFLINLVLLSFLLPLCVVLLTFYSQDSLMTLSNKDLSRVISKALLIPLVSIPVTALMFVILPRTGYPLLSFLNRGGASAGFTDNVKLGDISNIQENGTVILRVETERVDDAMLYWRGIVLDYFDGTSWSRQDKNPAKHEHPRFSGRKVPQTVYLEPYENQYLFALDKPVSIDYRGSEIFGDLTAAAGRNIDKRIKYNAVSVMSNALPQEKIDRARYLQLPHRDISRVETLVQGLATDKSGGTLAAALLHYLRDGQFAYSLKNLPVTDKPLEDFLFKFRYGNCEYFASSLALMLRIAGIPARLVGGYRGGYYNTFGGYYLVTQNNAHVWVEAYIDGKGWIRLDPTPGSIQVLAGFEREGYLVRARVFLDSLNYYWNAMIIGYDLNKQIYLFVRLRNIMWRPKIDMSTFKNYATDASFVLIVVIAVGALFYFSVRRKIPERVIIDNFMNIMEKKGYKRKESQGLREFAGEVKEPGLRGKALKFTDEFEGLFYRDKKMTHDDFSRLMRLLDDL